MKDRAVVLSERDLVLLILALERAKDLDRADLLRRLRAILNDMRAVA